MTSHISQVDSSSSSDVGKSESVSETTSLGPEGEEEREDRAREALAAKGVLGIVEACKAVGL